jgi:hypothetical protein
MKPTRRNSTSHHIAPSFPTTDYSFQETREARTSASVILSEKKGLSLHRLSSEFFRAEASRHYVAEVLLFSLITATVAWPLVSALAAVVRLVRNY